MAGLTLTISWTDVALRLALTVLASLLLGFNRTEHGKAAGMSTTLLVGLAAAVAMIQVNLLLTTSGRRPDSFVMNDLMRLPLGILTGVGFIGGGAILRRGSLIVGVTTAATLWLTTVIGLCFGGGQLGLGLAAAALGLVALWGVKWVEQGLRQEHRVRLSIELDATGPGEDEIRRNLREAGLIVEGSRITLTSASKRRKFVLELSQVRRHSDTQPPALLENLAQAAGVVKVRWEAMS